MFLLEAVMFGGNMAHNRKSGTAGLCSSLQQASRSKKFNIYFSLCCFGNLYLPPRCLRNPLWEVISRLLPVSNLPFWLRWRLELWSVSLAPCARGILASKEEEQGLPVPTFPVCVNLAIFIHPSKAEGLSSTVWFLTQIHKNLPGPAS